MNAQAEYETPDRLYCAQPPQPQPVLRSDLGHDRAAAILQNRTKWANGTVLHYAFLDEGGDVGGPEQLEEVRHAFGKWKGLGIGLEFTEVTSPDESEIRIAFSTSEGSKSTVGRDALTVGTDEPTTHYGWKLNSPYGRATALHELGHVIGFAHEHQNPDAGIVWDDEAVYDDLAGPPNRWPRDVTYHNILRKLSRSEVRGSPWDPGSVMEYPFGPGLIVKPEQYGRDGIPDPLDLSAVDKDRVQRWYPALAARPARLEPYRSQALRLSSGEQVDFEIVPTETRRYEIGTFGDADFLLVLFEERDGELRYAGGDDDSGEERNGRLRMRLVKGRRYVARARLYSTWNSGGAALMYW
ncbi:matrixin family metalloprotease [Streptomyces sp. NPDC060002]|uniref:matrixin family metalloprotease n=1 Tax=Streptomyces sp. NPDC060002 TaxID=3347033 RepID=UPI0036B87078